MDWEAVMWVQFSNKSLTFSVRRFPNCCLDAVRVCACVFFLLLPDSAVRNQWRKQDKIMIRHQWWKISDSNTWGTIGLSEEFHYIQYAWESSDLRQEDIKNPQDHGFNGTCVHNSDKDCMWKIICQVAHSQLKNTETQSIYNFMSSNGMDEVSWNLLSKNQEKYYLRPSLQVDNLK